MYPGVLIKYLRLIIEAFFNIEKYDYFFNDMQLMNLMFPRIFIENYIVLFTVKMVSLNIHRIKQFKKQIKNHIKCFNKKKTPHPYLVTSLSDSFPFLQTKTLKQNLGKFVHSAGFIQSAYCAPKFDWLVIFIVM